MRRELRAIAAATEPVPRVLRRRRLDVGLTIIGWHRVDTLGEGLSTPLSAFEEHLDVLDDWGAQVLPLGEAVALLAAGALPPKAVALTFDDGYASVVETAWPLLRDRGFPASLFVVSDYLDGDRTFAWDGDGTGRDELRLATGEELVLAHRDGLDIGSHTQTHPWLPGLDDRVVERELALSRAVISDLLGEDVTALAYPTGGWDRRIREAACRAGYRVGITVTRGANHRRRAHPLSLRRAFVPHDPVDLELMLNGAYTFLRPIDALRGRRGPTE
ncbi:hypothetical protein BH09ACT12_BH09ACT12_08680 [soil metagenome]